MYSIVLRANKTGFRFINLLFIICGKLSIIRCLNKAIPLFFEVISLGIALLLFDYKIKHKPLKIYVDMITILNIIRYAATTKILKKNCSDAFSRFLGIGQSHIKI